MMLSNVEGGRAYGLSFHLDRLIGSAAKAEIEDVPWSKEELRCADNSSQTGWNDCLGVQWFPIADDFLTPHKHNVRHCGSILLGTC